MIDVCIVGGGPAGLVCGLLLAQQGVKTLVLESHSDFSREYRGEVLMPRFAQTMKQVGLFEDLLKSPHLEIAGFELCVKNRTFAEIKVSDISPSAPSILWMPQPIMLNSLYQKAKVLPNFDLWFDAPVNDLLQENGRVVGVKTKKDGNFTEVQAKIIVGADGRSSVVRNRGGFEMAYQAHDFDIIWFTIQKPDGYDNKVRAFFSSHHNYLALPKYPSHIQCGLIVETGGFAKYHKEGIESLRKELLDAHPIIHSFAKELKDFSPFHVLAAKAERVKSWAKDGVVLIGDAAHTCSPAGAVGVSVAVATAIVAADVIADAIEVGDHSKKMLDRIQKQREAEVKEIQNIQSQASLLITVRSPFMKAVALFIVKLMAKTSLFIRVQRRLMVAAKPLPIKHWGNKS